MPRKRTSPIWTMPEKDFISLVMNSSSTSDMLRIFGLENKGGNSRTLWERIRFLQLNEEDIRLRARENKIKALKRRRGILPDSHVFCENSVCRRHNLKKRIIDRQLIPYVCSICGQEPFWQGKPMILILDHINGVSDDNRLNNLRFVCGNCNIQLETNAGKNR